MKSIKQFPTDAIEPQWRAWYAISLVYTGAATKGVSLLNTMRNKGEAVPQVLFGLLLVAFNEDRIDFQNALLAEADELDLKPEWRARFERNKVRQFLHAGSYQLALVQLLTLRDQAQKLGNQYAEDPPPTSNTWTPT